MKQNGIALSYVKNSATLDELAELLGEQHVGGTYETPIRQGAFDLDDEEKIKIIAGYFRGIMDTLGLDLSDDSLRGTPTRVAKMFVKEAFSGLNPANKPGITLFDNKYKYGRMLVEKDITLYSHCEHHFVPIIGRVHVAYISSGKVIGLSKLHRIVKYFARRPQVQERLTMQIANELKSVLDTEDVAVMIDASHLCVCSRGVEDTTSTTITAEYCGKFKEEATRAEFIALVK